MNILKIAQTVRRPFVAHLTSRNLSASINVEKKANEFRGWELLEKRRIAEFDIDAVFLLHSKTGAKYLHLGCPDNNNVFSVNFRTTPMDSTGVAHILEHTVLCGSQNYPVRDPFFKMLNRSLSTFMNAMTGPDYTLYPFSSCNSKDFSNLMSVYLDSVFSPLLREQDFLQEGWRLEPDDLKAGVDPIVIKGVVFNEMKGAYSNSQQLFGQHLLSNLLPSHTYGNSSGGFPLNIPELSWEQLKQFHSSHYHPSNARFFTYGSFPISAHLGQLETYLDKFTKQEMDTSVPSEPRWTSSRSAALRCAPDPMIQDPARQSSVAVSYLLADVTDVRESFVFQVLGELLLSGPAAPFYKSLIEPGLCAGLSPVSGYDNHTKDTTFTVGLQGVADEDLDKVCEVISETIDKVVEEGFPNDRLEGILHSVEMGLKHRSGNFGLGLVMAMTPYWNHADNPLDFLNINDTITWFRSKIEENPRFLQDMVVKYLQKNDHKLTQTMTPSETFLDEEQDKLDKLQEGLTVNLGKEDKENIYQKCCELSSSQSTEEDLACLPTLLVSDISPEHPRYTVEHTSLSGVPTQLSVQPTNQVSYFRAIVDTAHIPGQLKPYLPVLTSVLTKMGAGHLNFADFDTAAELATSGLGVSCHVSPDVSSADHMSHGLVLSSHCLDRNISAMFELWSLVFQDPHLSDVDRLKTLLRMDSADKVQSISGSGHSYAMASAASCLTPSAALSETFSGITHVNNLSSLSSQDGKKTAEKLAELAKLLLNKNNIKLALNCTAETANTLIQGADTFLSSLPGSCGSQLPPHPLDFAPTAMNQHYITPFPVNFTSLSCPTVPYSHPDHAPLTVLAALLSAKYLHREIREKGGAYGGGATCSGGTFSFYSYRDPHNLETFTCYRKSTEWAVKGEFNQADVDEAVLRVFQKVDDPVQPGYRGMRYFLSGVTDDLLDTHRNRLRGVTKNDVVRVADQYLIEPPVVGRTLLGPRQQGLEDLGWIVRDQGQ